MSKTNVLQLQNYIKDTGEYTVSEVSALIKSLVEDNLGFIRIRGEISGLKIAPSGHAYFSLKDSGALLSAVCWKGVFNSLPFKPKEGLEVVCVGSITTYAGQSKYQMIVSSINPAGVGALMAMLEKLKQQFAKEGLFDQAHKKKLPFIPKTIGVITSPTGAVIRDILHRISERFPTRVLVWPVLVQGEHSAAQIANAVKGFNSLDKHNIDKPDVIIVARGGGSVEDLWSFNEEIVVRAVFNSSIPIISAVGHETDTTLIDYVSDLRAPTPTAAAEFAVPVKLDLLSALEDIKHRSMHSVIKFLETQDRFVQVCSAHLPNLKSTINYFSQRLDELSIRLVELFPRISDKILQNLNNVFNKLHTPKVYIENHYKTLIYQERGLESGWSQYITKQTHQLELASKLLNSYSYKNTLDRGFSIVRNSEGKIIKSVIDAEHNQDLDIQLIDGNIKARVL